VVRLDLPGGGGYGAADGEPTTPKEVVA
jgi:hypothetical protein